MNHCLERSSSSGVWINIGGIFVIAERRMVSCLLISANKSGMVLAKVIRLEVVRYSVLVNASSRHGSGSEKWSVMKAMPARRPSMNTAYLTEVVEERIEINCSREIVGGSDSIGERQSYRSPILVGGQFIS